VEPLSRAIDFCSDKELTSTHSFLDFTYISFFSDIPQPPLKAVLFLSMVLEQEDRINPATAHKNRYFFILTELLNWKDIQILVKGMLGLREF
jgi:hypothetical protein